MQTVHIRVLFFGVIRDVVGLREDSLDLPAGGHLGLVFEHYAARFPRLRDMASSTVLALNQQFSSPAAPLAEGDEVALLPPVSGGSGMSGAYTQQITDPAGHFLVRRHKGHCNSGRWVPGCRVGVLFMAV